MQRSLLVMGALLGAAGVALGAFAAHGLRGSLTAQQLGWWQTGVEYQLWHAVALVALASLPSRLSRLPGLLICFGAMLFAATLYLMALTDFRWLGAVTPIGGAAMIAGWLLLTWRAWRSALD